VESRDGNGCGIAQAFSRSLLPDAGAVMTQRIRAATRW